MPPRGRADEGNPSEAYADLNNIGGIGDIVADAVVEFFAEKRNVKALNDLLGEIEVLPAEQAAKEFAGLGQDRGVHGLADKIYPRRGQGSERNAWARRSRAQSRRRPIYVVAGQDAGSKLPRRENLALR